MAGYAVEKEVDGFNLQTGNILFAPGILLNIKDKQTYSAIKNRDPKLLDVLYKVIEEMPEDKVINDFHNIDVYIYQGHSLKYLLPRLSSEELIELGEKALQMVSSNRATQEAKNNASIFLIELEKFYGRQQRNKKKNQVKNVS